MSKLCEAVVISRKTEEETWADVASMLQLLTRNGYECLVREELLNVVVIEFEHDPTVEDWGSPRAVWLTSEEEAEIYAVRAVTEKQENM